MRRRGLLVGGLGLAFCAGCDGRLPTTARIALADPVFPTRRDRMVAADREWLCGEVEGTINAPRWSVTSGSPPACTALANGCAPGTQAPVPGEALPTFAVRTYAPRGRRFPVQIDYWPDHPQNGLGMPAPTVRLAQHPEMVLEAAEAALLALERFAQAGLKPPLLPENGILKIELKNISPLRGRARVSERSVEVDRSLRGAALRDTVAHEIFHLVQYAYNHTPTINDADANNELPIFTPMLREGGARVAEMAVNPDAARYEADAQDWFMPDGSSLARFRAGRRRHFRGTSYGGALFWKYVAEQHTSLPGRNAQRPWLRELQTQRLLLEATQRAPDDLEPRPVLVAGMRAARARMSGLGGFDQFLHVDGDPALPACSETSWGNFQLAVLLNGTAGADSRFRFEDAARWRGITAGRRAIPAGRQLHYDDLPSHRPGEARNDSPSVWRGVGPSSIADARLRERTIDARLTANHLLDPAAHSPVGTGNAAAIGARMLDPFSVLAYSLRMPQVAATRLLRVEWEPSAELIDALVQVVMLNRAGELQDVYRHDGGGNQALRRTFACRSVSEVIIVVSSRVRPGDFRLRLYQAADAAILTSANWDALSMRYLTRDPGTHRPGWHSPDVQFIGATETVAIPGFGTRDWPGRIRVLVRNRGTERANGVSMTARRRPRSGGDWQPLICLRFPPTLETDDECQRLDDEEPLTNSLTDLPAPCRYNEDLVVEPSFVTSGLSNTAQFLWPGGAPADYLVRFDIQAQNDPNGVLTTWSMFGGGAPRLLAYEPG